MQSGSTNPNLVHRSASASFAVTRRSIELAKAGKANIKTKDQKSESSEISKSLNSVNDARKVAGENRGKSVSKTAMYAAAIIYELNNRDEKIGSKFLERFQSNLAITKHSNSEPIKPAAHQSLNDLVRSGDLSLDDVKKITRDAWKLVYVEMPLLEVKSESQQPLSRPVNNSSVNSRNPQVSKDVNTRVPNSTVSNTQTSQPSTGQTEKISAPSGFLWKPVADSAPHNLAVLLPPEWTGKITSLEIIDPQSGEVLATTKDRKSIEDGGVGNGGRQHFRFNQPGKEFPEGSIVKIVFNDGTSKEISVKNTASRTEGR